MLRDFLLQTTCGLRAKCWALAGFLLLTAGVLTGSLGAQVKPVRRVLLLDDLGIVSSPGFAEINQAVFAGLQDSPYQIELYQESLELTLFPDEIDQFRKEFVRKYSDRRPDVIITAGSASMEFITGLRATFIRDIPVVFCAILGPIPTRRPDLPLTGVLGRVRPEDTLDAALHMLPDTKHVVVTGGVGKFDAPWEAIARQAFQKYESKLQFTYLTDLTLPGLLERLRHLPNDTIVYHTAITEDSAGSRFIDSTQSVPLVVGAANAPVFVMDDVDLKDGAVGGHLVNWADDGRVAAAMALRVLNGERPQDIPIVASNNTYMFDWRALKRWGLNETNLPVSSVVINRQLGFWALYKQYVIVAIIALLAQTIAILGLLWQRAKRRKTEVELRRSEERFSKSFRHSPLAISLTTANDDRYIEVNETFEQLTGWAQGEVAGRTPRDLALWVDPERRTAFVNQLIEKGQVQDLEVRLCRKDGQIRTMLGSSELIDVGGEPCFLSVFADITARKNAEDALAGVSRRLIDAQEQERMRIARELHDDINQRIAMLGIKLDVFQQSLPRQAVESQRRLNELRQLAAEIGTEVQGISHRLHSSKLEYLGLVAACRSFCREVADVHKMNVNFTAENIPSALSQDVSLCLFRVLQESLSNAIKHSAAQHFEVQLCGTSSEIQLTVRDHGIGFDADEAIVSRGLGLISMRERVSVVNGMILIASKPMRGTEITVRVPVVEKGESKTISGAA